MVNACRQSVVPEIAPAVGASPLTSRAILPICSGVWLPHRHRRPDLPTREGRDPSRHPALGHGGVTDDLPEANGNIPAAPANRARTFRRLTEQPSLRDRGPWTLLT